MIQHFQNFRGHHQRRFYNAGSSRLAMSGGGHSEVPPFAKKAAADTSSSSNNDSEDESGTPLVLKEAKPATAAPANKRRKAEVKDSLVSTTMLAESKMTADKMTEDKMHVTKEKLSEKSKSVCDHYKAPPDFLGIDYHSSGPSKVFSWIPFVNRYAEVFDTMMSALSTAKGFAPSGRKRTVPLATQIMGTGKTFLGYSLVYALNRPRESPELEEEVGRRLLVSLQLQAPTAEILDVCKGLIEKARLMEGRNESLVTRALRVFLEDDGIQHVDELVDMAKQCKTVLVKLHIVQDNSLYDPSSSFAKFDSALAKAIIRAAAGDEGVARFTAMYRDNEQVTGNAIKMLVSWYGPLMIVLDEIAALAQEESGPITISTGGLPADCFSGAMNRLAHSINCVLNEKGVFVYCAGSSSLRTIRALSSSNSPMFSSPIIIHPLREIDVALIMAELPVSDQPKFLPDATEEEGDHRPCSERELREYFISKLVRLSGGNGRVIEFVLTCDFVRLNTFRSKADIDSVFRSVRCNPNIIRDTCLVPKEPVTPLGQARLELLLQLVCEYLLLDRTFGVNKKVSFDGVGASVLLRDLLNTFGMSYTLCESPVSTPTPGLQKKWLPSSSLLRIVAGTWQLELLQKDYHKSEDCQQMLFLLNSMARSPVGILIGRPFERLCFHAFRLALKRSVKDKDSPLPRTLASLLPHLEDSSFAGKIEIPDNLKLHIAEEFPRVVAAAAGSSKAADGSDADKAAIPPVERPPLEPCETISSDDFAAALVNLEEWTMVAPADQSESQDWLIRLPKKKIIGFTNKAGVYPGENVVQWSDINDELNKGKSQVYVDNGFKYTLVVYATQYGEEVMDALGDKHSIRFSKGKYRFSKKSDKKVVKLKGTDADAVNASFEVAEYQELIIVNPKVDGGLNALFGNNKKILDMVLDMGRRESSDDDDDWP